jgi:hypothetical protein
MPLTEYYLNKYREDKQYDQEEEAHIHPEQSY